MTLAPWQTCSDPWAQDLLRQQEEFDQALKRSANRKRVRDGIEEMIDRDNLFLRLLLSDVQERLNEVD